MLNRYFPSLKGTLKPKLQQRLELLEDRSEQVNHNKNLEILGEYV